MTSTMPIYVTVQPDEKTRAQCLVHTTGAPMLAVHDPTASVMFTVDQEAPTHAVRFASELITSSQQFTHEARRYCGFLNEQAIGTHAVRPNEGGA